MAKIGIIGLGKMGLLHLGTHSALAENSISAVAENDSLLAKTASNLLKNVKVYDDFNLMLREQNDVDSVVITTPIHTHASIIQDVLSYNKGINIFVEKPLAVSYEQATSICKALGTSTVNMVGFQKRFAGTFSMAKNLLSQEAIGDPLVFRSYSFMSDIFRRGSGWRFKKESGGVTLEVGPHVLDLIIWFFGEPAKANGTKKIMYSEEVEDYVHADMEFRNGLMGYLDLSWSIRNYRLLETLFEIHGTKGSLTVNDDYVKLQLDERVGEYDTGTHIFRRPEIQPSVPFLLGDPEFCLQEQEFIDATASQRQVESSFLQAAKVNLLIDKIKGSA